MAAPGSAPTQVAQFERLETGRESGNPERGSTVRLPAETDAGMQVDGAPDSEGAATPVDGEAEATGAEADRVERSEDATPPQPGRDDFSWSARKGAGLLFMAGAVPSLDVLETLSALAGADSSDALLVMDEEGPSGFARDAEAAMTALALVSEGQAVYRNGAWRFTATVTEGGDEDDVRAALGKAATPVEAWSVELEGPGTQMAATAETQPAAEPAPDAREVAEEDESTARVESAPLLGPGDSSAADGAETQGEDIEETAESAGENSEPTADVGGPEPSRPLEESQPPAESETEAGPSADQAVPETVRAAAVASDAIESEEAQSQPAAPAATAQACKRAVDDTLGEQTLLFASGRSQLTPESEALLPDLADALGLCPDAKVYVEGHTDSVGVEARNLSLSVARAETVVDGLVTLGVSPSRLYAIGYGESLPLASNDTAAGRQSNRRIVFRFSDPAQPVEAQQ